MFVIAGTGVLLAGLSIAAFFGDVWWPLDLVANFRPQLAVLLLGMGILLLLGRWHRTGRVVLAVMVVNLALVGWLWVPETVEPVENGDPLTVVSFNVLAANERYDDVLAFVDSTDADVVFLHESSLPWEEAAMASDLGYEVIKSRDDDHIFGTLVLVRGEAEVESFGFTEREPRGVEVIFTTASGRRVALLGIHPVAPVTAVASGLRDAQMAFAANWARNQDLPTVVAGDFNAGPWSHSFRSLKARTGLRDSQRGFGLQPSFPASSNIFFRLAIDHLLVSEDVTVVDRWLGPSLGSDHFPVVADLSVGG